MRIRKLVLVVEVSEYCVVLICLSRLGAIYNAATGFAWQERIEEWAKETHSGIWEELSKRGYQEDETGVKKILGIDRSLGA